MSKLFRIAEIFGPTIQGEGNLIGTPCVFVRFGGCDYRCPPCDSPHAVLPELVAKLPQMDEFQIYHTAVEKLNHAGWVVYSGGNPLLLDLSLLTSLFHKGQVKVMVETQGSVYKNWLADVDDVTISPKGPGMAGESGTVTRLSDIHYFLNKLYVDAAEKFEFGFASFKVVCFDEHDLEYATGVHQAFPEIPMFLSVGNHAPGPTVGNGGQVVKPGRCARCGGTSTPMDHRSCTCPEGYLHADSTQADIPKLLERLRWLSETVANSTMLTDCRVLPQMHVLTWGNERGR